jgi:hypothetical protein
LRLTRIIRRRIGWNLNRNFNGNLGGSLNRNLGNFGSLNRSEKVRNRKKSISREENRV